MTTTKPTVGRIVHYVSRGDAQGVFPSQCRAAIISEVPNSDGVRLCVLNPQGIFFDYSHYDSNKTPGSWHWPQEDENDGD